MLCPEQNRCSEKMQHFSKQLYWNVKGRLGLLGNTGAYSLMQTIAKQLATKINVCCWTISDLSLIVVCFLMFGSIWFLMNTLQGGTKWKQTEANRVGSTWICSIKTICIFFLLCWKTFLLRFDVICMAMALHWRDGSISEHAVEGAIVGVRAPCSSQWLTLFQVIKSDFKTWVLQQLQIN